MVTDPKINADDTGRLVSGTDANGNTIPPDTFVGAVSDTGPIALSGNASSTTASNNYAKPWIGTFQLLNDSGQPVTLPGGFDGNVTLSAEGATSTVGARSCPSGNEAATTSGCVTADPLYDPTDFTPGGGDTGTVLISPLIKPGTVSSTYYNHYSSLRTMEDLFLTGHDLHRALAMPTPRWPPARSAGASTVRATSATRPRPAGRLRPGRLHGTALHAGERAPGYQSRRRQRFADALYCPKGVNLGCGGRRQPARVAAASVAPAASPERPAVGRMPARAATAAMGSRRPGTEVTAATAATAPARPRNGSTGSG